MSKNIRIKITEKDEEEISDGEIEDDIDVEIANKLKQKFG